MDQVCTLLGSSNKSCILGTVLEDWLKNCMPLPLPKESSIRHRRWADAANTAPELYVTCRDSLDELVSVVERHAACCKQPYQLDCQRAGFCADIKLLRSSKTCPLSVDVCSTSPMLGNRLLLNERRAVFDFVSSRAVKPSFPCLYNEGLEAVS